MTSEKTLLASLPEGTVALNIPGAYAIPGIPEFVDAQARSLATKRIIPVLVPKYGKTHHRVLENFVTNTVQQNWAGGIVDKVLVGPVPAADTDVIGYVTGWNSLRHIVFVGDDHNVHVLTYDEIWRQEDLTTVTAPGSAASGSLAAYTTDWSQQQHIVFMGTVGTDNHVFELMYDGAWRVADLTHDSGTTAAPTPPAASSSPLVGYASSWNNQQHVIYLGADRNIHELICDGGVWHHANLTDTNAGVSGMVSGSLSGYTTDWTRQQHINFTTAESFFDVLELMYDDAPHFEDLVADSSSPSTPTPPAAVGSPFVGYVSGWNQQQHVIYLGNDNNVHELMYDGSWHHKNLTSGTSASGIVSGSLSGYTTDWTQQQHIVFTGGANTHVFELQHDDTKHDDTWHLTDLTKVVGVDWALAGCAVAGYASSWNQQHHIAYIGADNNVYELSRDVDSWSSVNLTYVVSRPVTPWITAAGSWVVPSVFEPSWPPLAESDVWRSTSWIGIDGDSPADDVLQAGVSHNVDSQGKTEYYAWYEWYAPDEPGTNQPSYIHETTIPNISVHPGDEIYCGVQYINNQTAGSIFILNKSTGENFTIALAPPYNATFIGASVEWIMEADTTQSDQSMPAFSPVVFTDCLGADSSGAEANPLSGRVSEIDNGSRAMTSTTVADKKVTVKCAWDSNDLSKLAGPPVPQKGDDVVGYVTGWNDQQHVLFVGDDQNIHELVYDGTWQHNNLTYSTGTEAAASVSLAGYTTDWLQQQHVVFIGTLNHVFELMYDDAWHVRDLTADSSQPGVPTPPAAFGSPLVGYASGWNQQQHVVYLGDDGNVHELMNDGAWHHNNLTGATTASGIAPHSLAAYTTEWMQQQHIVFTGTVGDDVDVFELMYDNAWHVRDLTADSSQPGAPTPPAASSSRLVGYASGWNNQQHVIYLGNDSNVHELMNDGGLHHKNLTDKTIASGIVSGSVSGYTTDWMQQQHIVFTGTVGADVHVFELMYDIDWHVTDLTKDSGTAAVPTLPAGLRSPLVGYASGWNQQQHVIYFGVDVDAHELMCDSKWHDNNLTSLVATPMQPGAGATSSYVSGWNQQQHVIYLGADGNVHELMYDGAWHYNNLTVATAASGIASHSLAAYTTEWIQQQHIVFTGTVGADVHVFELMHDNAWHVRDLTADSSQPGAPTPPAAARSPLVGYAANWNQQQHVIYVGNDGNVHELMNDGGWHHKNLTDKTIASGIVSGSLSGYTTDWMQQQHIMFTGTVGADVHVFELMYDKDWNVVDLTKVTGAAAALADGALVGYASSWNQQQHVFFVTRDDAHLQEILWDSHGWHAPADLTQLTGAPPVLVNNPALVGYAAESVEQLYLFFVSATDNVHALTRAVSWYDVLLAATPDLVDGAAARPLSANETPWNRQQHVNCIGADHDVRELRV
jgi:hypothetical protein